MNKKEIILSETPISANKSNPPVIIVGMPRSGSSFLAEVTSMVEGWYVFDDLYLYRKAKSIGATDGYLSIEQLETLVDFLGWQIRARIKFGVFCVPEISYVEVDAFNNALITSFRDKNIYWHDLQTEWMTRLALNQGATHWGYKAPQDFQIVDQLQKIYPNARYLFIYRDPQKMLSSLKFVREQDGNPAQYHPLIYSLYWKKAYHALSEMQNKFPDKLLPVSYEELANDPDKTAISIAHFLESKPKCKVKREKTNSSFTTLQNKDITPTEKRICEAINKDAMQKLGYPVNRGKFRIVDLPDLTIVSIKFAIFQFKRIVLDKTTRVSIFIFLKGLIKKAG